MNDLRRELAEAISGHPIGQGYYSLTVSMDEAREMINAILPIITRETEQARADILARAWDEGFTAGDGYGFQVATGERIIPTQPTNPYRFQTVESLGKMHREEGDQ